MDFHIVNLSLALLKTHLASRHYLSSDLSAFSFGLGLQAFQASALLPLLGGYSYVT